MKQPITNKPKNTKKSRIQGSDITSKTRRSRLVRVSSGPKSDLFTDTNEGFYVPIFPDTYIHSYVNNFHDMLKVVDTYNILSTGFNVAMQPIKQHIEFLKQESLQDFKVINQSGQAQDILEYFSQPVQPLNDLRLIKDIMQLMKMAISGQLVYQTKEQRTAGKGERNYYLSADLLDVNFQTRIGTRTEVVQQVAAKIKQSQSELLKTIDVDKLAEQIISLAEESAVSGDTAKKKMWTNEDGTQKRVKEEIAKLRSHVKAIDDMVGNTIMKKLENLLESWNGTYRKGNIGHLQGLKTMGELFALSSRNQDFGFLAEVLRANALNGTTVGDEQNDETASDIEYIIHGADGATRVIQESMKFYKNDIYNKTEEFTGQNLINLCQVDMNVLSQLNYFLSNYFILGKAEAEGLTDSSDSYMANDTTIKIYNLIVNFIRKIAFFAAVYQGGAKNSITDNSNKLPMLLTVNKKTIFTYQLWEALEKQLNTEDGAVFSTGDIDLELETNQFTKMKDIKKNITASYKARNKPFDYSAYLKNNGLMNINRKQSALEKYRSTTLAKIKVSVDMAKIMNNQGGQ